MWSDIIAMFKPARVRNLPKSAESVSVRASFPSRPQSVAKLSQEKTAALRSLLATVRLASEARLREKYWETWVERGSLDDTLEWLRCNCRSFWLNDRWDDVRIEASNPWEGNPNCSTEHDIYRVGENRYISNSSNNAP